MQFYNKSNNLTVYIKVLNVTESNFLFIQRLVNISQAPASLHFETTYKNVILLSDLNNDH